MVEATAGLGPITKRKLSDEVLTRLEAAIREGTFPPGSALPSERELMTLFGVGRPSIREALYALQRRGLLRLASGERPRVIQPTSKHLLGELGSLVSHLLAQPDGVAHFDQARQFLELGLVRYACKSAPEAAIHRLRAALAANEAAIGDEARFAATDVAFHRVLAELPGNPIFVAMHDAVVEWLISRRPPLDDAATNNRMSYAGHLAILQAVEARDTDRAFDAMQKHLDEAYNRYVRN